LAESYDYLNLSPPFSHVDTTADNTTKALAECRILIVDDDRLNIRILSGMLKAEGYQL